MPFHCHVSSVKYNKYNKYTSFFSFVPISSSCSDMEKLLCFGKPPFNNNKLYKGLNAQIPFLQLKYPLFNCYVICLLVWMLLFSRFLLILFISSEICINFHNPGSPWLPPFSCLIILNKTTPNQSQNYWTTQHMHQNV